MSNQLSKIHIGLLLVSAFLFASAETWASRAGEAVYKAALVETLACDVNFYSEYAPNVQRWYEKLADEIMFVNLSLLNPAGDRLKPPAEQRDVYMHVVKERDDGIVVRGARMDGLQWGRLQPCHLYESVYPAGATG